MNTNEADAVKLVSYEGRQLPSPTNGSNVDLAIIEYNGSLSRGTKTTDLRNHVAIRSIHLYFFASVSRHCFLPSFNFSGSKGVGFLRSRILPISSSADGSTAVISRSLYFWNPWLRDVLSLPEIHGQKYESQFSLAHLWYQYSPHDGTVSCHFLYDIRLRKFPLLPWRHLQADPSHVNQQYLQLKSLTPGSHKSSHFFPYTFNYLTRPVQLNRRILAALLGSTVPRVLSFKLCWLNAGSEKFSPCKVILLRSTTIHRFKNIFDFSPIHTINTKLL